MKFDSLRRVIEVHYDALTKPNGEEIIREENRMRALFKRGIDPLKQVNGKRDPKEIRREKAKLAKLRKQERKHQLEHQRWIERRDLLDLAIDTSNIELFHSLLYGQKNIPKAG